jgi:hypothetical protein
MNNVFSRFSLAALLLAIAATVPAQAEGKLEARYAVSVAGIKIGKLDWTVNIDRDSYTSAASGKASGVMSALVSGEGAVATRGSIRDGRPVPESFTSSIVHDGDKSDTKMVLDGGDVKDVTAETEKPAPDRVPLSAASRHGIVDPVTALLIPMAGAYDVATKDACQRTLPIFDGRRRYDLTLSFKRMDHVKAEKGYAGPVAVCAVAYKPQAGHRASSKLVKYLAGGRDIELWLAPVPGARLVVPFRASVASMVGNLVIEAVQFDVATHTAAATKP